MQVADAAGSWRRSRNRRKEGRSRGSLGESRMKQITHNGVVTGTEEKNDYGVLEIKAVKAGVVVIKGIRSNLYLCMDSRHQLYASAYDKDDCHFHEKITPDNYNMYSSEKHSEYVSLAPLKGSQMARFLPIATPSDTFNIDHHDVMINTDSSESWNGIGFPWGPSRK
ncbi:hypothetical protein XENTR_v10019393 [Xenopus tropicalis]|uniref:Fibroblast growth factor n=1 Tax=Xenopus tropicalis TaxID=8364 RepID=A0A8J0T4F6_XENTR|nr:fibroblast growth factor 6-like isoform X2 [Xenopus tropicalis]KAE8593975.1 hypothetical protein XENTR_v10019393 [Xenopus tropicalis]|eukprot:XP_017951009.1 PREDICTED: fibroblast growth factor 6-like isoform X2 [Xenopus tropicalis]